jgi:hypothetical protein
VKTKSKRPSQNQQFMKTLKYILLSLTVFILSNSTYANLPEVAAASDTFFIIIKGPTWQPNSEYTLPDNDNFKFEQTAEIKTVNESISQNNEFENESGVKNLIGKLSTERSSNISQRISTLFDFKNYYTDQRFYCFK